MKDDKNVASCVGSIYKSGERERVREREGGVGI